MAPFIPLFLQLLPRIDATLIPKYYSAFVSLFSVARGCAV